jgi:hypothetical protein
MSVVAEANEAEVLTEELHAHRRVWREISDARERMPVSPQEFPA